jgi:signal transduction histidine kinase
VLEFEPVAFLLRRSLFARLLTAVVALVLAGILLVSAAAIYLLPGETFQPPVVAVFLGFAVVILVAVGVDVYFLARDITRPVEELARAARAIAGGELETPVAVEREDEIGALASDFRIMQRQLAQSRAALEKEKLRYAELNELKDGLLANVPHEVKTPLSAIAVSLEMLEDGELELSEIEKRKLLESIKRSVLRLQALIDNMLDAASIQAGQFTVRPEATRIGPILSEAAAFVEPLTAQNDQRLAVQDRTGGALVNADPVRLTQVLVNLFSNAIKYGAPGETIVAEAHCENGRVRVEVANRGQAIPAEDRQRLFERFSRTAADGHLSGVGLGLAISKTIVELQSGEIGLGSDSERGTRVWFSLPCIGEVGNESPGS